ncbi:hypothetical protein Ae406Ps2_6012c [Pseudonocardia sp. Ae406_Ps2]|uniref:hypothetical protein n=1 Tax=unclassified Pseudonocardia TaxID=2619320 RepID=UPI00094AE6BF|nr:MULTISPECIES: hypothetical protein [unclassified Pseudonocardia]OLL89613.1 hypothetical protein Ae331Ps2_5947 [Pseudonocardia sp. Ae331_Ps2]OLL96178.1 hypothetical protein Ae406Ps2_6012c [Pseudonocardia sp. Ae406_Ps2]OLM08705.1 hypothetical protein Ae505Ps2_6092c [Pseudonocardia sp. Ae505_Ps2]OLM09530.1 hypothetical protein Ae706Ps2_5992 [Pseudonocardia sp. Ae706_Ps2]OLM27863.1 hypothetical protein Ae717Ps2_7081c [Pseudonocardia sp. Ae717_Ps2]
MGSRTRRRPEGRAARHALAQLTEARDAVDARLEDRRRRENVLLERYAATLAEQQRVEDELTAGLGRLARLRADTDQQLAAIEADRGDVLVGLNAEGRSAEDLAQIAGLPLKRVRTILRSKKQPADGVATSDDSERTQAPAPRPAGEDDGGVPVVGPDAPVPTEPDELAEGPSTESAPEYAGDTQG